MSSKKYEHIESIINHETGEIIESKHVEVRRVKQEKFMQVYIEDIAPILKIKQGLSWKVLIAIWSRSDYNTNRIILVKKIKEDIAKEVGGSYSGVANSISYLLKLGMLVKGDGTAIYYLNPKHFFKGELIKRGETIKKIFSIEYKIE